MVTENEMKNIGTGAVQSPQDYRYIKVEHLAGAAPEAATFPQSFHIDYSQVPDLYQRQIGECTNCAFVEILMHRVARIGASASNSTLSARFPYALSKMEDGLVDKANQGTYPNMPFKIAVKYGIPTVATCADDTTLDFNTYIFNRQVGQIPSAAFTEADQLRIPGYVQVGSFQAVSEAQLKQALTISLDGISICMPIGTEWWTAPDGTTSWDPAKILPIRKVVTAVSGHCVVATGWEMEGARMKVFFRNHWSKDWANQDTGFFYLDEHTISEAWMISEIPDALLAIVKSLPAQKDFSHTWNADLAPGQSGVEVQNLQIALKIAGAFPFNQPVTQYFGNITRSAVMQFQSTYGVTTAAEITAAAGKVGPKTRAALNKMFSHQ